MAFSCFLLPAAFCLASAQGLAQAPALPNPYPSTYQALPRTDTLITDATVFDGIGHTLLHAGVLLHDGKITATGSNLSAPPGTRIIDAHGGYITPGLIAMS